LKDRLHDGASRRRIEAAYSNWSLAMSTPNTPNAAVTPSTQPEPAQEAEVNDEAAAPHDGDHNQGGARPAGLEYQRELGTEQDA
jgi:hypothetical protein